MNLLHLKYAVEIAHTGSISKAAENLYMNQPNLSRAIKELEDSLGITIFKRTPRGMVLTVRGKEFLQYAKNVLNEVEQIENLYNTAKVKKQRFSVSVPRSSYISAAFVEFSKKINNNLPAEIFYKETNALRAIDNIIINDYRLGIIRYQQIYEAAFKELFIENGLNWEVLGEFQYKVVMAKNNPLAAGDSIKNSDLTGFIEIAHADPFVPSIPLTKAREEEFLTPVNKRIFVFERGSQFDLLQHVPNTFMWVSPIPNETLDKYQLCLLSCDSNKRVYRDVLIYRKGYKFTELDKLFITEVCASQCLCKQEL